MNFEKWLYSAYCLVFWQQKKTVNLSNFPSLKIQLPSDLLKKTNSKHDLIVTYWFESPRNCIG